MSMKAGKQRAGCMTVEIKFLALSVKVALRFATECLDQVKYGNSISLIVDDSL